MELKQLNLSQIPKITRSLFHFGFYLPKVLVIIALAAIWFLYKRKYVEQGAHPKLSLTNAQTPIPSKATKQMKSLYPIKRYQPFSMPNMLKTPFMDFPVQRENLLARQDLSSPRSSSLTPIKQKSIDRENTPSSYDFSTSPSPVPTISSFVSLSPLSPSQDHTSQEIKESSLSPEFNEQSPPKISGWENIENLANQYDTSFEKMYKRLTEANIQIEEHEGNLYILPKDAKKIRSLIFK